MVTLAYAIYNGQDVELNFNEAFKLFMESSKNWNGISLAVIGSLSCETCEIVSKPMMSSVSF